MKQTKGLIATLKKELKRQGLTYADLAKQLGMSEANIKRLFASGRFSVERLEQICALAKLELTDLVELYQGSLQRITQLSEDQEEELVSDIKLLLVAVCVRNHLSYEDIVSNYTISEPECVHYLAQLDRLKIIDLLPGNRIKLRIDEDFRWLPGGPIEQYYREQIQTDFLNSDFTGDMQQRLFLFGFLSDASVASVMTKIKLLAKEIAVLHRQDARLPLNKRNKIGAVLAVRHWELEAFLPLKK